MPLASAGSARNIQIPEKTRFEAKAYGLVGINSDVRIVRAQRADLDRVLEILEEASRWLISKGLETRWHPSPTFRQSILENIDRGEVYVVKDLKATIGTITLQWRDQKFWGDLPLDAGYVHKVAIKRSFSGQRLGLRMLQWAEVKARAEGKR